MNTIDDLREALSSLERLAPEQLPDVLGRWEDLPNRATRGHSSRVRLLAAAGSVAVVIAVAVVVLLPRDHHSTVSSPLPTSHPTPLPTSHPTPTTLSALGCPTKLGTPASTWVPAHPQGFDATSRLAPAATPQRLIICAYPGAHSPVGAAGAIRLTANLNTAASLFSQIPPGVPDSCDLVLEPTDGDQYLVRLSYQHVTEWLSVSGNHCEGVTNGEFTSSTFLGSLISSWYRTGQITASEQATCATPRMPAITGRIGQQTTMVPGHPTAAELCDEPASATNRTVTGTPLNQLVSALNQPPAAPMTMPLGCQPTGPTSRVKDYLLIFHYQTGPEVIILAFAGCAPQIENGNLAIETAPALIARIQQLQAGGAK